MRTITLSTDDLRALENIIFNRDKIELGIQMRKMELAVRQVNETPEVKNTNVSSEVENLVIKFSQDPYIIKHSLNLAGVRKLKNYLSDDLRRIFEYKYIDNPYLPWIDVGKKLGYSKSGIYRQRYAILEVLNNLIGYTRSD